MIEPSALQKYSLFGGLLEDQIEEILPFMEQESYGGGEAIIVEGTLNDRIRFILEGRVAVIKKNLVLWELGEGDFFGEMEFLDTLPSAATIKTLIATRVMVMSHHCLRQIYTADSKAFSIIIMNLARDLSRRLRYADDLIAAGGALGGPPPAAPPH
jgi:CRP-like cAMP-binding protein